jgi:hypothetical protein
MLVFNRKEPKINIKKILLNSIFLNMVNLDLETCPQFNFLMF